MKPYTDAVLSPKQRYFNYCLNRARMVTECAYGQLKGRWRVLLRKCESSAENVRTFALACMVLHNVCLAMGDTIPKKLDLSIDPDTNKKRNREKIREVLQMQNCTKVQDSSSQGESVRAVLTEKLWLGKETGQIQFRYWMKYSSNFTLRILSLERVLITSTLCSPCLVPCWLFKSGLLNNILQKYFLYD